MLDAFEAALQSGSRPQLFKQIAFPDEVLRVFRFDMS